MDKLYVIYKDENILNSPTPGYLNIKGAKCKIMSCTKNDFNAWRIEQGFARSDISHELYIEEMNRIKSTYTIKVFTQSCD